MARKKEELRMERMGMSDIEGKAAREAATEPGGEGVSIMK
jgi:hypothetical protein